MLPTFTRRVLDAALLLEDGEWWRISRENCSRFADRSVHGLAARPLIDAGWVEVRTEREHVRTRKSAATRYIRLTALGHERVAALRLALDDLLPHITENRR